MASDGRWMMEDGRVRAGIAKKQSWLSLVLEGEDSLT